MQTRLGAVRASLIGVVLLACSGSSSGSKGTKGPTDAGADAAPGFPVVSPDAGTADYTFQHGGLSRTFRVHIPTVGAANKPLVVVLHGGGGSAAQMFKQHALAENAESFGYVVVAGQGMPKDGEANSYDWNGQVLLSTSVDDVGYLETVITGLSTSLGLDVARRYVVGFSGGASMTVRFGAERSNLLAAVATFAGKVGLSESGGPFVFPTVPTTPLSVQMTYGSDDPNYEGELKGTIQATSAKAGMAWWATSQKCASTPATETTGKLTFDTYGSCQSGVVVRMITVDGMGHTWPDKETDALDGTKLVFEFFRDKSKP